MSLVQKYKTPEQMIFSSLGKIGTIKEIFFYLKVKIPEQNITVYNPGHNVLEIYNILVQIRFTTSNRKLDT